MSTPFYDLASLVVVPSGVKAQKVYAQKPMTTDGQLTFSRASTATRVNASGLIETVASNVPRLDYLGSTCPKLLLEPQRVNLALQSSAIDNAAWIKGNGPIITTNIATAPDGTTSADGIQDSTGGSYKTIAQNISLSANSTLTLSFFVKKETSETAFGGFTMYFQGSTAKIVYGIVNAVTGAVTYASSTLTPTTKVEDYGTYWRIASTATDNGSNTLCSIGYYGTLSANGTSLSPAIGSVRTVWGFQAEIGAYATSYIPTTAAAVTRLADACSKTGISSLIGQTEGTLFVEVQLNVKPESGTPVSAVLTLNNNVSDIQNSIILGVERDAAGTNRIYCLVQVSNVTQAGLFGTNITSGNYKIALAYKANDFALYVNGVQVATDTSGSVPTTSQVLIGTRRNSDNFTLADRVSQALVFPTRLSNADLAALTA